MSLRCRRIAGKNSPVKTVIPVNIALIIAAGYAGTIEPPSETNPM